MSCDFCGSRKPPRGCPGQSLALRGLASHATPNLRHCSGRPPESQLLNVQKVPHSAYLKIGGAPKSPGFLLIAYGVTCFQAPSKKDSLFELLDCQLFGTTILVVNNKFRLFCPIQPGSEKAPNFPMVFASRSLPEVAEDLAGLVREARASASG